jgi:hypothetical protein
MMGLFDDIVSFATQPLRDAAEVLDGLTEGELRTKAATRLGKDVVAGMALEELIVMYKRNIF